MAGSRAVIIATRRGAKNPDIAIEGVSCLGRCDRAPAACVSIQGEENDRFYHSKTVVQLRAVLQACLDGNPPPSDSDAPHEGECAAWMVDPYAGGTRDYGAVRAAVALRDASIKRSADLLAQKHHRWTGRGERLFQEAGSDQARCGLTFPVEQQIADAVLAWQTGSDFKGRA